MKKKTNKKICLKFFEKFADKDHKRTI